MSEDTKVRSERESRPSPVDKHVGSRIRLRRTLMGISQVELGSELDLTFQQVQKYEQGVSRVAASRLFQISQVLDVLIGHFFEDMPEGMDATPISRPRSRICGLVHAQEPFSNEADEKLCNRETLDFVRAYYRITDPAVRKLMFDLIDGLTPGQSHEK